MDFRSKVIVGNLVLEPSVLRSLLVKSHYYSSYDPEGECFILYENNGGGGRVVFQIRNISYESAAKLAKGLGLAGDGSYPTKWSKWNPRFDFHHDKSADADRVQNELLRLGIPHRILPRASEIRLEDGRYVYTTPFYSADQMIEVIRETAKRDAEQLSTTP